MSAIKDLIIELLMELLKEEWTKRQQLEEKLTLSEALTRDLLQNAQENEKVMERRTRTIANMHRHHRIECDESGME